MFHWARAARPSRTRRISSLFKGRISRRIRWNCPRRRRRRTGRLPQSRALPQEEDSKLSTTYTLLIVCRDGVLRCRQGLFPGAIANACGSVCVAGFFKESIVFFKPSGAKRCQFLAKPARKSALKKRHSRSALKGHR